MRVILLCWLAGTGVVHGADARSPTLHPVMRIHTRLDQRARIVPAWKRALGEDPEPLTDFDLFGPHADEFSPQAGDLLSVQYLLPATRQQLVVNVVWPVACPDEVLKKNGLHPGNSMTLQALRGGTIVADDEGQLSESDQREFQAAGRMQLRGLLDQAAGDRIQSTWGWEFYPSAFATGRGRLRIRQKQAEWQVHRQRRDAENATTATVRSMLYGLLSESVDLFVDGCTSLSLDLLGRQPDEGAEVALTAEFRRGSRLAKTMNGVRLYPNRCLDYLHPQHTGFATLNLPVSDDVADVLNIPGGAADLLSLVGAEDFELASVVLSRLLAVRAQPDCLQLMLQEVREPQGGSGLILTFPRGPDTDSWTNDVGMKQVGFQEFRPGGRGATVFLLGDGQAHDSSQPLLPFYAETEQCAALLLGPVECVPLLQEVLSGSGAAVNTVRRYDRALLAADFSASTFLLKGVAGYASVPEDVHPLNDRVTVDCRINDDEIRLGMQCEQHAVVLAMQTYLLGQVWIWVPAAMLFE